VNWLERRRKSKLLGYKRIKIKGMRFVIRRVNPLMDFPVEKVPQLFTELQSARKPDPTKPPTIEQIKAMREQMLIYIEAGVVEPRLVPVGVGPKNGMEEGLTAEDLCRDQDMGTRLYWAILSHSLNTFKGIKSLFFSIKQKLLLFILLRIGTVSNRWMSSPHPMNPLPTNDNSLTSLSRESPLTKNSGNMKTPNANPAEGTVNG
jgi:hypothetical protein